MSAAFLQALALALPGAELRIEGVLAAATVVLDKPLTLIGIDGGGLRGQVVVRARGVRLDQVTIEGHRDSAAIVVDGGSLELDRCNVVGGSVGIELRDGVARARATRIRDSQGDAVIAASGALTLEDCTISASGGCGVRAGDADVQITGGEIRDAGSVGLLADASRSLRVSGVAIHGCDVNLEVRGPVDLDLDALDLGPARAASVWVHTAARLRLSRSSVAGAGGPRHIGVSATDGARLRLDGCTLAGGATTLHADAATVEVTGSRLGPANPDGAELSFQGGAAVKLATSSVRATGSLWSTATVVCLDTSFDGPSGALALRGGALRADGSTFATTGYTALRLDGCDAQLERCHLRGRSGLEIAAAQATLGRCEIDATEGFAIDLQEGASLRGDKCLVRGGSICVKLENSELTLSEVKISGHGATRTGIEANAASTVSLTRCQIDRVEETGISASRLDADSTHVLGGAHWGLRVPDPEARATLRRCLLQAPVGYAAASLSGEVELIGCNLAGTRGLELGPDQRGHATRCQIGGTEVGVSAFNYGIEFLLDDCTIAGPTAVSYKRGYALTLRAGSIDGTVHVEDRRLILDQLELTPEVGPRGEVVQAGRAGPSLPAWCTTTAAETATASSDAGSDWHRYHELLDDALADPSATVTGIPDQAETAPRLALERRAGAVDWPRVWRLHPNRMRRAEDFIELAAVWVSGATGHEVMWNEEALEFLRSSRHFERGIRGEWSCGPWALRGEGVPNDSGNPRDGYGYDLAWTLLHDGAEIWRVEGQGQAPYPQTPVLVSPNWDAEACYHAAALVWAWNQAL